MNKENDSDKLSILEDNINNILNNKKLNSYVNSSNNLTKDNSVNDVHLVKEESFQKEKNTKDDNLLKSNFDNNIKDNSNLSNVDNMKGDVVTPIEATPSNNKIEENRLLPQKNDDDISSYNSSSGGSRLYFGYGKRLTLIISIVALSLIIFLIFLIKTLRISSSKKEYFSENSSSSYSVCLMENNYYEEECLPQNRQYISSIVNNILYTFTYNSLYTSSVEKNYNYNIKSSLKIFSADNETNPLFEKEYFLLEDTSFSDKNSVFTISDSVLIPFKEYYDYVTEYSNTYGVSTNSEVSIDFNVNDKSVSSLTIPLGKQTFNISKRDTENTVSVDREIKARLNVLIVLYLTILIISGLVNIIFAFILFKFLYKTSNKKDELTKYKNELSDILKNYDRIIVEVKNIDLILENKPIVKVDNFLELVDVRDTLDKPIMHMKINDIKDGFYVDEGNKVYSFIMKSK